ncbi:MAG: hypothetical protein WB816_10325 [Methylocystis sp.]
MRADPDDHFSVEMFADAEPASYADRVKAPRAKWARIKAPKLKLPGVGAFTGWTLRDRRPDDDSRAAEHETARATAPEPEVISAEASSEARRAPSYDELWREPRRHGAFQTVTAPAPRDRAPGIAGAIAILIGIMALIAMREKIVEVAPPTAKVFAALGLPVNLTGLELREVRSHIEMEGARKVLAVEGEITNMRRESKSVPAVSLTVRGEDGQDKYAWTTRAPKSRLEPGETIAFRARLASPPETGADVLVRFAGGEETAGRKPGVAGK